MSSPAERYASAQTAAQHPQTREFAAAQRFALDPFQLDACQALERGRSVLVAAPTGAGKTIVGEFAIHLAMQTPGDKAFYTTPMKALSNQKFRELVDVYGADEVGLLTGDTNINGNARIVVMTTEVLRNMLYAGSDSLRGLRYVVMDEVHYLADRFRGPVWEEVILHLPQEVRLISLSATVSNAEEFGDWLDTVRGDTDVIVSEIRPVPLEQHVLVRDDLLPLFDDRAGVPGAVPHPLVHRVPVREQPQRPGVRQQPPCRTAGEAPPEGREEARAVREHAAHRADGPSGRRAAAGAVEPAAGHLLHLQQGRLRRRRAAGAAGGHPPHHAGGAHRDPRDR
jgi:ATP-dependent RNA helicase HelY